MISSVANRVALVCPVHKPKFALFERFAESYHSVKPDCDLYFVLSQSELPNLAEYRAVYNEAQYFFTPDVPANDSVITYKKFYGLAALRATGKYDGIAAVDTDSLFVSGGFHQSFDRFRDQREVFGYPLKHLDVHPFHEIVKVSCDYFTPSLELEKYRQIYSWWNTIPWYVSNHVPSFLASIGYHTHRFSGQSWSAFDHVLYLAWLCREGLASVGDRHYFVEYPERMRESDLGVFSEIELDWLRYSAREQPIFAGQKPIMYFHTDRELD